MIHLLSEKFLSFANDSALPALKPDQQTIQDLLNSLNSIKLMRVFLPILKQEFLLSEKKNKFSFSFLLSIPEIIDSSLNKAKSKINDINLDITDTERAELENRLQNLQHIIEQLKSLLIKNISVESKDLSDKENQTNLMRILDPFETKFDQLQLQFQQMSKIELTKNFLFRKKTMGAIAILPAIAFFYYMAFVIYPPR